MIKNFKTGLALFLNGFRYIWIIEVRGRYLPGIAQGPEITEEIAHVSRSTRASGIVLISSGMAAKALQSGVMKAAVEFAKKFAQRVAKQASKAVIKGGVSATTTSFTGPVAVGVGAAVTTATLAYGCAQRIHSIKCSGSVISTKDGTRFASVH